MMLPHIMYYSSPSTILDAVKELTKAKGRYAVLAGGTSSLLHINPRLSGFISLKKLPLDYIRKKDGVLKIGSMTRIQDILENKTARGFASGLLFKACFHLGSTLNRHLITCGGNLAQIFRWSDLPVALLVLDTKIRIKGLRTKTINILELLKKHPKTYLKYNDIITEIEITAPPKDSRTEFIKFSRTSFDHSLLDIAVLARIRKGQIEDIRIAYGAVRPLPFRALALETEARGQPITDEGLRKISRRSAELIEPASDFRVSRDYQKALMIELTWRALKNVCSL